MNPNYTTTNNKVGNYFQALYPGTMESDATGKMQQPDYDMTEEEFIAAQNELDNDLEESIAEIESNMETEDAMPDMEQYITLEETIPVKVLYPDGRIDTDYLYVYDIDMPENPPDDNPNDDDAIYVWSCTGDNPCEVCEEMDGTILDDDHVPQPHPNCSCEAVKMPKSEYKKKYGAPSPTRQKKYEELRVKEKEWKMNKEIKSNVLTDELKTKIAKFEGIKPSPYTDSKHILTIGVGNNVSKLKDFVALDLTNTKTGEKLTINEKAALYDKISAEIQAKTFNEKNYTDFQIPVGPMYEKFDSQLNQSFNELEKKFPDFDTFPVTAQQALLDMQFNIGDAGFQPTPTKIGDRVYSGWPKLFDAVDKQDWQIAAKEGYERKDVQQDRKDWTRNQFMLASD